MYNLEKIAIIDLLKQGEPKLIEALNIFEEYSIKNNNRESQKFIVASRFQLSTLHSKRKGKLEFDQEFYLTIYCRIAMALYDSLEDS